MCILPSATPYWFYPVKYLSWIRYGWTSLMVNEFKDMQIGSYSCLHEEFLLTRGIIVNASYSC